MKEIKIYDSVRKQLRFECFCLRDIIFLFCARISSFFLWNIIIHKLITDLHIIWRSKVIIKTYSLLLWGEIPLKGENTATMKKVADVDPSKMSTLEYDWDQANAYRFRRFTYTPSKILNSAHAFWACACSEFALCKTVWKLHPLAELICKKIKIVSSI